MWTWTSQEINFYGTKQDEAYHWLAKEMKILPVWILPKNVIKYTVRSVVRPGICMRTRQEVNNLQFIQRSSQACHSKICLVSWKRIGRKELTYWRTASTYGRKCSAVQLCRTLFLASLRKTRHDCYLDENSNMKKILVAHLVENEREQWKPLKWT